MKSVVKFMGAAAMALALSGTLSACGAKNGRDVKAFNAYLIKNPYLEQSEAEQAKTLQTFAIHLNKGTKLLQSTTLADVTTRFEADPTRDMLIMYGVYEKPVTAKQFKDVKKALVANKAAANSCRSQDVITMNLSGFGIEMFVKTQAGDLLYEFTCPGKSVELYVLEESLIKTPYETRTKAQKAEVIQGFVAELNKREDVNGTSNGTLISYNADVSRGVIITLAIQNKVLPPKELEATKKGIATDKRFINFCKSEHALKMTLHGFGSQLIVQDTANNIYYESEICTAKLSTPKLRGSKA